LAKVGKVFLLFVPFAKAWKRFLYKIVREHDYEKTKGVMRETFKKIISENLKPLICSIKVPVLILWGEKDVMTPFTDALFIKKTLPKSKLVAFQNNGHKLPYEKPKQLAKEINKWGLEKGGASGSGSTSRKRKK
jgi:pimeloyl-ACP methyl ester carboxylesterase